MRTNRNYYFFNRLKIKHIPLHVQIELTVKCNNNCIHCIREKDVKNELTAPELRKVFSQLSEAGCIQLTFTGGEPLLRDDFFEISDFARSQGFVLRLFSNATLINNSVAKRLKELKFKEVRITLFSVREEVHDSITQIPGSLKKTLKAIGHLKKNRVPFRISAVITKRNIYELKKLRARARKENWQFNCEPTIYPTYTGKRHPLINRVSNKEIEFLKNEHLLNHEGYRNVDSKKLVLDSFYLGNLHCYISADGRVFPHATIRLQIGNLKEQPFKDIWRNSPHLNQLRNLDLGNFECSKCSYFLDCRWDIGLALSEHGRITARPKEQCRLVTTVRKERKSELRESPLC